MSAFAVCWSLVCVCKRVLSYKCVDYEYNWIRPNKLLPTRVNISLLVIFIQGNRVLISAKWRIEIIRFC